MSASESRSVVVLELAEEFLERYRQGQRPSLKEYIDRHPELAAEIKEVFPAMALMENVALADESLAGEPTGDAPATDQKPPEQLGDFRILREVGRGGMGIVYEAEQMSLGRHVALKVLPRKMLVDATQRRRFEREAKAAARLHHTNIVPVFGVGEHDGLPYYVMQFIQGLGLDDVLVELKRLRGIVTPTAADGELRAVRKDVSAADVAHSLLTGAFPNGERGASAPCFSPQQGADALRSPESGAAGKLSDSFTPSSSVNLPASGGKSKKSTFWQSVASIGVQVAGALEHAHKQRILHRDIKPSNLLLDTHGTVWVADFGLARAETEDHLTHTGDIVGTLRYMPPEAFEGRTDPRSDVYSLGLTLYELLALRPAFADKDRHQLIKRVTSEEPTRLDKHNRAIPRDLVTIVHKAIDREPARRYATAGELAADLQHFIDDEPIQARRISLVERGWRWCRHNSALAAALSLAAVALLAVTILSTFFALSEADFARRQARSNEDLRQEQERTKTALRELRISSAWAAAQRGQGLFTQGQLSHGLLWLARALELAPADDQNLSHTIRTNLASLRGQLPILRAAFVHPLSIRTAAFSPDGRIIALTGVAGQKGEVRLFDAATGQPIGRPLPYQGALLSGAVFSPDGKMLLIGDRGLARFWDVAAGSEIGAPLDSQDTSIMAAAFSPDGQTIALATRRGTRVQTRLWDAATRKPKGQPLASPGYSIYDVAFSPDGKTLATAAYLITRPGECRLWDAVTGKARGKPLPHPAGVYSVAFSPDGKTLATAGGRDMKARLWDVASARLKGKPLDHQGEVYTVAFRPDGRVLLSAGAGTVRLWAADTGQPLGEPLPGTSQFAPRVSFSPDGQSILVPGADGITRLWSLPSGRQLRPPAFQPGGVSALALSRDGQRLLVRSGTDREGEIRLWDAALNKPIGPARVHKGWYYGPTLSPDGKTVLMSVVTYAANTVQLWDGASGKLIGEPLTVPGGIYGAAFSPDGKTFLVSGWGQNGQTGQVQLADAASGKAIAPPLVLPRMAWAVAFSPDGKTFLTGSNAAGERGEVRLWDADTCKAIGPPLRHRNTVRAVAFRPDGKVIASGSQDGIARLWDASTGEPIGPPLVHQGEVNAIAFSPDSALMATACDDSKVRIWSAATGRPIGTPLLHARPVNSVLFTPDGATLITGSDDRTIRFWQAPAPLPGTVESIKAWAEWTSGMTLSSEGAAHELEASAWEARREKLAGTNPFALADGRAFPAHLRQALECMESEDWPAALWHLDREIQAQPNDWPAYVWRTQALVQLGRREGAAADFDKAIQLDPPPQAFDCYRRYAAEAADKGQWQTAFWYLDRLIAARPQQAAFYLDRGRAHQKRNQNKEAAQDFGEALKHEPNDPQIWQLKGRCDINLARWPEAEKAWDEACRLDPSDHWSRYQAASLHLYLGDEDGYRRQCQEMLQRFGSTDNPYVAERTAKTCLLVPDAAADKDTVQQLAQRAVASTQAVGGIGWFQLNKGIAEYRAGRPEQALHWLGESQKQSYSSQGPHKAMAELFRAMAHARLGRTGEARQTCRQAAMLIDTEMRRWETANVNPINEDWLKAAIVRKEAEALVEGKQTAPQKR
jgi:eukaryotic-like serine/threonine-protein kinase